MIDQLAISLCKSLKLCKSGANNDGDTETTIVRSTQHQLKPAIIFIIHHTFSFEHRNIYLDMSTHRKLQNYCGTTVALTMWNHFPNLLENVEPFSLKYRDWFQFVEPFSQFILNSMENKVEPIWFHIVSI